MNQSYSQYTEKLPDEFSVRHKITQTTEKKNFHLHRQLEIIFALSDNLKCKFETGTVDIPKNSFILFNQMDLHYVFSQKNSGLCDRYVLYFSSGFIAPFSTPETNLLACFLMRPDSQPAVLTVPDDRLDMVLSILKAMEHCQIRQTLDFPENYGAFLQTQFLLGEFLILINRLFYTQYPHLESPSMQNHIQLAYDIHEYIGKHYQDPLSTEDISKLFLISKTQLYYIFKQFSGMTVSDYITEYRITKAKDYLINSDYSVEIISQAVGYQNISSFSRVFKSRAGCSPLQYRKKTCSSS